MEDEPIEALEGDDSHEPVAHTQSPDALDGSSDSLDESPDALDPVSTIPHVYDEDAQSPDGHEAEDLTPAEPEGYVREPYEYDDDNPYLVIERTSAIPAWLELLMTVIGTLVLAVLIRVFVAETYEVPSGSMLETIQLGDRLVGEKVTLHWSDPVAGDIVTFNDPDGSGTTLIKRVIATEGQVVDLQDGYVLVDGKVMSEPYVLGKPTYALDGHASNLSENVTFPYIVPSGCLWVMGDNRTNSLDSRYFGAIPIDSVTSKALFIYWPTSDAGKL